MEFKKNQNAEKIPQMKNHSRMKRVNIMCNMFDSLFEKVDIRWILPWIKLGIKEIANSIKYMRTGRDTGPENIPMKNDQKLYTQYLLIYWLRFWNDMNLLHKQEKKVSLKKHSWNIREFVNFLPLSHFENCIQNPILHIVIIFSLRYSLESTLLL